MAEIRGLRSTAVRLRSTAPATSSASLQAEKHRGHAGSDVSVLQLVFLLIVTNELAPIRGLPTIEDAPRPTACAAADVQVVSSRGAQAAMS